MLTKPGLWLPGQREEEGGRPGISWRTLVGPLAAGQLSRPAGSRPGLGRVLFSIVGRTAITEVRKCHGLADHVRECWPFHSLAFGTWDPTLRKAFHRVRFQRRLGCPRPCGSCVCSEDVLGTERVSVSRPPHLPGAPTSAPSGVVLTYESQK